MDTLKSNIIKRPSNNIVLEFKELSDLRRSVIVYSTEKDDVYKVVTGLNALNCIKDIRFVNSDYLKSMWVDLIIHNYECVKNEIFMRGIHDILEQPTTKVSEIIDRCIENLNGC
jgi:uncharacterized protein YlbG (UPF0298 family)